VTAVVMFPGQGVQQTGMGASVFAEFPDLVAGASELLGFDVQELCEGDHEDRLSRTLYAQPATYVVNALEYRSAYARGLRPDVLMGHSLGEFNALEAAGAFSFLDGLSLVRKRAATTDRVQGAMTAVQGLDVDVIGGLLAAAGLSTVDIANLNTPTQTVLAGPYADIAAAEDGMVAAGAIETRRLRITGAFHSRYMAQAAEEFGAALNAIEFREPRVPVVANVTARPHSGKGMAQALSLHLTRPVMWHASVTWVVEHCADPQFVQPGRSQVLIRMLRQIPATRALGRAGVGLKSAHEAVGDQSMRLKQMR
jgi:malonyl CoA-acyl carrier protein transacylase